MKKGGAFSNRGSEASFSGHSHRRQCCNIGALCNALTARRTSPQRQIGQALLESELADLIVSTKPSESLRSQTAEDTESCEAQLLEAAIREGCEGAQGVSLNVAVLLSGGVDSSLALHLLKKAGHQVTAFYLQIWFQEDFANFWGSCPWEDDLKVCQEVCQKEGVHLEVVPLTKEYWDKVVSSSVESIKHGFTPNPDILCNSRVKFGAFYEHLEACHKGQFDRIASGHYARLVRGPSQVFLHLTPDPIKDQTYFLASLYQEQLSKVMFPLGCLTKAEVRQLATAAGLPNNLRRDSQGICFLGKVRFEDFVQVHLGRWPGPLVDEDTNQVVGYHEGFWFYTPGQRKGIFLSGGPWYVSRKDTRRNVIYISRQYYTEDRARDSFQCGKFNWISGAPPQSSQLQCKVRHGPQLYDCKFDLAGDTAVVGLNRSDQGIAAGQYAVFYEEGVCLGSAVILSAPPRTDSRDTGPGLLPRR